MNGDAEPTSYGILRQRTNADALDAHVEDVEVTGFTVIESDLEAEVLADLRERADRLQRDQVAAVADFNPDQDIVRCALVQDDLFLRVATLPTMLEMSRRLLGDSIVLLQQNVIFAQPSAPQYQARWHRDLPYQHFTASGRLAISLLVCLDDFTVETGGTMVLPGSHMFEAFPSARLVQARQESVEARAGSVIVMDAMLYHRTGNNISPAVRRGINHVVGRPFLVQQIDIPRQLGGRLADDSQLAPYLGYRWNPAPDVDAWRRQRS